MNLCEDILQDWSQLHCKACFEENTLVGTDGNHCGAESGCACACIYVVPIAKLSPLPQPQWGLPQSCTSALQALWAGGDKVAPEPFHLLAFGSLVIPAPCAGHRHCWQLLSKAGPAVLAIAVKYFPQGLKVLPGKSSVCARAVSHTQKNITYPSDEIGWFSVSLLLRVLNTGASSTHRVCDFW